MGVRDLKSWMRLRAAVATGLSRYFLYSASSCSHQARHGAFASSDRPFT